MQSMREVLKELLDGSLTNSPPYEELQLIIELGRLLSKIECGGFRCENKYGFRVWLKKNSCIVVDDPSGGGRFVFYQEDEGWDICMGNMPEADTDKYDAGEVPFD